MLFSSHTSVSSLQVPSDNLNFQAPVATRDNTSISRKTCNIAIKRFIIHTSKYIVLTAIDCEQYKAGKSRQIGLIYIKKNDKRDNCHSRCVVWQMEQIGD